MREVIHIIQLNSNARKAALLIFTGAALFLAAWLVTGALAHPAALPAQEPSPMHPTFSLLDASGAPVLESGQPVSARTTCGECHDTAFIEQNSDHANSGLEGIPAPGASQDGAVYITDAKTGRLALWEQPADEAVEMNCFLCHTPNPNNTARIQALTGGLEAWATTATLLDSGIVSQENGQFVYNPQAFTENGELAADRVTIQDPTSTNCGQCHGTIHTNPDQPLVVDGYLPEEYRAGLTGQVISPQRMSASGTNLAGKADLSRAWDIHAERMLQCTDCHFSLNNPVYFQEGAATRPEHLSFDPRRLEIGEYLQKPLHQFARGVSSLEGSQPSAGTMRRCESCHLAESTHTWLPYSERHFETLSCETCHISQMYAPAFQQQDWTVVTASGEPKLALRGLQGETGSTSALVTGYQPALLPRQSADGETSLAPFNLVASWYWAAGDPPAPIALADVQAAWLENGAYSSEVLAAFDADGSGQLSEAELVIDTSSKQQLIASRLTALGHANPHIVSDVKPYSINHGVATGNWVTKDCRSCHGDQSRVAAPIQLAAYTPGGVLPALAGPELEDGSLFTDESGALFYQPQPEEQGIYVFGHNRVGWVDLVGSLAFVGVLLGVGAHGGLRVYSSLRQPKHAPRLKRVYMYAFYERLWHWLQTLTILALLFTGLIIHKPDTFGVFSFRYVVLVHNVLAAVLVVNAALSLFYHLVSGEIRQYIPRPAGFFDQAIEQAIYYLRGIFKGELHPFEKTPDKKLNPLQQVTYFATLNVLLPLQIITGALMWGAQHWPDLAARLGGLPLLAPFHTLVAWLFAAFVVMHVYLTTTGHTPLANIQAMIMGWDDVETHAPAEEEAVA